MRNIFFGPEIFRMYDLGDAEDRQELLTLAAQLPRLFKGALVGDFCESEEGIVVSDAKLCQVGGAQQLELYFDGAYPEVKICAEVVFGSATIPKNPDRPVALFLHLR